MEIIRKTQLDGVLPERIEFNYQELKDELAAKLATYNGKDSTNRSNYKERKADRARLNDLARALNQERINIKKQLLAPIDYGTPENESFSNKIDDLIVSIKMVIGKIDAGIKAFEESEKEKKREDIMAYLHSHVVDTFAEDETFRKSGHFDRWAEEQMTRRTNAWLNATCSNEFIQKEIRDEITRCANAVMLMKATYNDEDEVVLIKAKDALALDFDTNHMMQVVQSHKDQIAAIERANAEKAKREEAALAKKVNTAVPNAQGIAQSKPTIYSCTMKFVGTAEAFKNLKEYLSMNTDITYQVVKSMEEVKQS